MAYDLNQWWGNDLTLSPSGDLAVLDSIDKDNQRIVRRICTNGSMTGAMMAEYIFHPDYGGSAPWYVGQTTPSFALESIIRAQMYMEQSVAHDPEPTVSALTFPDGSFDVTIKYINKDTGQQVPPLTFNVS